MVSTRSHVVYELFAYKTLLLAKLRTYIAYHFRTVSGWCIYMIKILRKEKKMKNELQKKNE